ncbi:hypothetical protein C8Q77DRAFT_137660 [Trametes polyzona]|nr:hypothetical protein C8Q77DRAFT_137660 [Trametes polyzona]
MALASRIRHAVVSYAVALALLMLLSLLNVTADLALVSHAQSTAGIRAPPLSSYSLIADDYPAHLPLPVPQRAVMLSLDDSAHYDPTQAQSRLEWAYTFPFGDGNVRLGHSHRFFNTGFSYQLHCLRIVVTTLEKDGPLAHGRDRAHVERCLNVLRQFTLCAADTTLEPALAMGGNYTAARVFEERACADWNALYGAIEQNWEDWQQRDAQLRADLTSPSTRS